MLSGAHDQQFEGVLLELWSQHVKISEPTGPLAASPSRICDLNGPRAMAV
jgi:hypothetical protein